MHRTCTRDRGTCTAPHLSRDWFEPRTRLDPRPRPPILEFFSDRSMCRRRGGFGHERVRSQRQLTVQLDGPRGGGRSGVLFVAPRQSDDAPERHGGGRMRTGARPLGRRGECHNLYFNLGTLGGRTLLFSAAPICGPFSLTRLCDLSPILVISQERPERVIDDGNYYDSTEPAPEPEWIQVSPNHLSQEEFKFPATISAAVRGTW